MDTARILAALDEELARLREIRELLTGGITPTPSTRKPGRPPKTATSTAPVAKKRILSDDARQRIADAQKRRWAAQKGTAG